MDALDSVIDWLETYKSQHHPKVELTVIFTTDNNSQSPDPRRDRRCIVSAVCFADDVTEAKTLLGAVARGAPKQSCILCNEYQAKTFQGLLASSKAAVPIRHAVDTVWTSQSAEALQQIGEHFTDTPSRDTHVFANYRAIPDLKTDAAYSIIAPMFILSNSAWIKPEDDEACLHWSDQLMKSLQPSTEGCYINETDFMRYPERVKQCFTSESIGRLKVVRARYDPAGMFPAPFELG